jgi:hypothetical protein
MNNTTTNSNATAQPSQLERHTVQVAVAPYAVEALLTLFERVRREVGVSPIDLETTVTFEVETRGAELLSYINALEAQGVKFEII